ncbi:DUF2380 domain-containing protein [Bradyrhizobium sp. SZCCHNR1020]|uniref:DUF2380 domain-containing protein n=1 Tax=Bradyrhizobium sp. SZCCHNR1020 TaxID=3057343 RepID=UPI002915F49A|nr:DUF2380 domain-containing protein [Bradyrhizobium sp. SZCCHNR1020]
MISHSRLLRHLAIASLIFAPGFRPAGAEPQSAPVPAVVVGDFSYLDTSGEPTDQSAVHQRRLQAFIAALHRDVAADQRLHLRDPSCAPSCLSADTSPDQLRRIAREAGAQVVVIGSIQKMSTLVQWARAAAVDVASNRVIFEKLFTFRGDNDEAWERAETFVSREIRDAVAAAHVPVRLALLPFALEDTSAAAGAVAETESDLKGLADATEAVRQLLDRSGRYRLVEVNAAAKPRNGCDDCELRLAQELGADQSLIGVVGRISRTEYTIRFQLRDAKTGAVIATGDSGLRMGANYSWGRGAVRLVQERLLGDETR